MSDNNPLDTSNPTHPAHVSKEILLDCLCAVLCNDPVNWPDAAAVDFYKRLLETASQNGIDSLICHHLRPTDAWQLLPDYFRDELLHRLKAAVAIEMIRQRDLLTLLGELGRADIDGLVLKGAALAYTHYPEPYLRSRCDTDIFIGLGDIEQTREIMTGLGYGLWGPLYKGRQYICFKKGAGGALGYDIHWRINNRPKYARALGHEEAMRESVAVPCLDGARTLKPAHALLMACMHLESNPDHDSDRLIWLYDIHLLVSVMSIPALLEFAERAVRENIQVVCRQAVEKSVECFATGVPEEVQAMLSVPEQPILFRRRFSDSPLGLIIDDVRLLPGLKNKAKLIQEYLFPAADYLLDRYGKKGWGWVPVLYFRYLFAGVLERFSLR